MTAPELEHPVNDGVNRESMRERLIADGWYQHKPGIWRHADDRQFWESLPDDAAAALAALDPPSRVYALAVRAAETEYQRAIAEAKRVRQATIDEALRACETAMISAKAATS